MAAKTPPIYYAGNDQPNSSLGTAAVNGNAAFYNSDYLYNSQSTHNSHSTAALDPPASSSPHQYQAFYAPDSSSSYTDNHHLFAPAPTRPTGKFTEEWDASQRGSSIINGPIPRGISNNMSSIQRSNSTSGSVAGGAGGGPATMDGSSSIQVSRSNTLKKKSSIRRNGSLRRAGSRRSMKAGSVRSLALQSNGDDDEMHNAFYCPVPTSGNPTEVLANRFQGKLAFMERERNCATVLCVGIQG